MAAIIAVVLAGGVVAGMGALVIDVGRLYLEREELQTGADAASMKVALNCAKAGQPVLVGGAPAAPCTSGAQTTVAVGYAEQNAKDLKADAQICINNTGCPAWNTAAACPPLPTPPAGTTNGNYVEVRTTTKTKTGGTLLPPKFAHALSGQSYTGTKVGACARVSWGPPVVKDVLAVGISLCDWVRMTGNGAVYYGPLGSLLNQTGLFTILGMQPATSGKDDAIVQVGSVSLLGVPAPNCVAPNPIAGPTVPRGYAFLNNLDTSPPNSQCEIKVQVGDLPRSFLLTAGIIAAICRPRLTALRASKLPVLVPLFDKTEPAFLSLGPGYRIVGFAPFVVTGFTGLGGPLLGNLASVLSGSGLLDVVYNLLCSLSSCLSGYFTKQLVPMAHPQFGSGRDYGAVVIGRTG